ncbi:MAG: Holliday junction resolvase RuvX [Desulfonatronovibrio sp.]
MRYLGIDFGIKRVGLAVSSTGSKMAFPLKTIFRTTRQALFEELVDLIGKEKIEAVVLGMPLGPEGEETYTARQAANFKKSLERRTHVPVYTVNEAYTSCEAQAVIKKQNLKPGRQKKILDQVAAVLILETFLNQQKKSDSPPSENIQTTEIIS